jgi:subtilisin family serine protease
MLGGGYGQFCGTSSATPVVTGIAALAVAARPDTTPAQIADALEQSSAPIGSGVRYGEVQAAPTLASLGVRAPATPATTVLRGRLSPAAPARKFTRMVEAGVLTLELVYSGPRVLRLSVTTPDGVRVASRSGRSPLRFAVSVPAGPYRFTIAGTRPRARFTLTLSAGGRSP